MEPELADFTEIDHYPYMYRITQDDGSVAYRSDMYSRWQIGGGKVDPEKDLSWDGKRFSVDGAKSCSVAVDPEKICRPLRQPDAQDQPIWSEPDLVPEDEFWKDEFDPEKPLPTRLRDLVIYELHIDGLGVGRGRRVG